MTDLDQPCTQARFGELVGVTQQAIGELVAKGVLTHGDTLGQWLLVYTKNLREQAAGRSDSSLVFERARLAREQADRVQMANQVRRRELVPLSLLTEALASLAQQVAARLEALPQQIRTRIPHMPPAAIDLVISEIDVMRELACNATLNLETLNGSVGNSESDSSRVEAA
jgi:terminase small subunit / prophage DNA-packing protein